MATLTRFWPGESHGQKEPGGLQFMGSQRVGQGLVVETSLSSGLHYKFDITAHSLYRADSRDTERTVIQFVVRVKDSNPCVFCWWWWLVGFLFGHTTRLVGSSLPNQGLNLYCWQ